MPESTRNTQLRQLISDSPWCFSSPSAIPHVNTRITLVRIAVARVDTGDANKAVAAAKNAERKAQNTQVMF
jgi:hypothetical protein